MSTAAFLAWGDYSAFAHFVKYKARHILNDRSKQFLEALLETAQKRQLNIKADTIFWRAQLAFEWSKHPVCDEAGKVVETFEVPAPASQQRMVPLADRAYEGRVNPKGIPCLYLSTEKNTAMAEVRPWVGSYVSVAQFVIVRDLILVDCAADQRSSMPVFAYAGLGPTPSQGQLEQHAWSEINKAFSEPATRSDDEADYAPTQVIAEAFRSAGYDGLVYGSKLGDGKTIALFDVGAAEIANCELNRVDSIGFEFSTAGDTYYVNKYYQEPEEERMPAEPSESRDDPSGGV